MPETISINEWDRLSSKQKKAVTKINFIGTKKVSDISHRPTMAFATMCKDEDHCIGKTLNAVKDYVDYVVVADNGSTDKTFDIVRSFFKETGLPGSWHVDEWFGFDKNKTLMMSYVKNKTDYVIHLDADDFLEGNFKFDFVDSGADKYYVVNKRGGSKYWCTVIYDNNLTWKFCGVAHTIIRSLEKNQVSDVRISENLVWIDNAGTGNRALDSDKFLGDAIRLKKQYKDTLIDDPDGLNSRSVFYCAQSYKNQGDKYLVDSLRWYKKYMSLKNTWFEEEYECQLAIAEIKSRLNHLPELGYAFNNKNIEDEYLKAISIISDRAEAYFRLGKLYNHSKQFRKGYNILHKGKKVSLDLAMKKYKLFIIQANYEYWFNDELSVACYYLNKKSEGINLIEEVINNPDHANLRDNYQSNLKHLNNLN